MGIIFHKVVAKHHVTMYNVTSSYNVGNLKKGEQDMENNLRGAVLTKYSNITCFAKALNWDRKKASRIVNRVQKPSADDMEQMAKCLEIHDADSFVHLFLP